MTSRAHSTVITNLSISWGKDPKLPSTIEWFNQAMSIFEGTEVTILAAVIDQVRQGDEIPLTEIKELVRVQNQKRVNEPSGSTGYHRSRDRQLREDRISVFNSAVDDIRFSGPDTMVQLKLGRSMMARAKVDGRLIEDEAPHVLYLMDETEIGHWLRANFEPTPERKMT